MSSRDTRPFPSRNGWTQRKSSPNAPTAANGGTTRSLTPARHRSTSSAIAASVAAPASTGMNRTRVRPPGWCSTIGSALSLYCPGSQIWRRVMRCRSRTIASVTGRSRPRWWIRVSVRVAADFLFVAVAQERRAEHQRRGPGRLDRHPFDAVTGDGALDQRVLAQLLQLLRRLLCEE